MSNIRIEYVPIQKFKLGWFGLDHLQLVYELDEIPLVPNPQDDWYVLEGDSEQTTGGTFLGVLGTNGRLQLNTANLASGTDLIDKIGTPASRGSRIIATGDNSGAWAQMAEYGHAIENNDFPYIAYGAPYTPYPTFNSSSVIASVLWHIGIDVNLNLPIGLRISPGTSTFLGTENDDVLTMPTGNFDTIAGGYGDDDISGTNDKFRVDKLFGGGGDDTFYWSTGFNVINGGEPTMAVEEDGTDTVDYSGAGSIIVNGNRSYIRGLSPNYIVSFTGAGKGGGTDWLYSIERLRIDGNSDTITFGKDVNGILENLTIDMGAQQSGQGDVMDFAQATDAITIIADKTDEFRVREGSDGNSKSWWVTGAEWVIGSAQADEIHLTSSMRGTEGGNGDDILDARAVVSGTGASPLGYDCDLSGGDGADILISGAGRTHLEGGDGADKFVIGRLTDPSDTTKTEITIDGATSDDRLLIPLNFFDGNLSSSDNSFLMPLLGAAGSWSEASSTNGLSFVYKSSAQDNDDQTDGVIPFSGDITYYRDGSDLLIVIIPGTKTSHVIHIEGADPWTITFAQLDYSRETTVRVLNFSPGDLGMQFTPLIDAESATIGRHGFPIIVTTNLDEVVARLTSAGNFTDTLAPVPITTGPPDPQTGAGSAHAPIITGTVGNDVINTTLNHSAAATVASPTATANVTVNAGAGDDVITTGGGDDVLNGGTGADTMTGGAGNDTYYVDNPSDQIIERAGQGLDTIIASIDYSIGANVENLTLVGGAINGIGNGGNNTLQGNDGNNVLSGGAGNDTLYGGGGDDSLMGGAGSDSYLYQAGSGHTTIIDGGPATDINRLALINGIKPSDIHAYRLASAPNDLYLAFPDGGWIKLQDQLIGNGVSLITFDDGTVWTRANLASLSAPIDTTTPPSASDDTGIALVTANAVIPGSVFLANDTSASGLLTIVGVSNVSIGTASVNAGGDIVVAAPQGYLGLVSFTYTIADEHGQTSSATATVTILPGTPVANADTIAPSQRNTPLTLSAAQLLANDSEPDGRTLSISSVGHATHGTVSQTTTGNIVFTPDTNYVGAASFTYTLSNGVGATAVGTANLTFVAPPPVTLSGTSGNDTLTGGAGDDMLSGGDGNDVLNGSVGADTMIGGDGSDAYYVDNIGDQVIETNTNLSTGGSDIVFASINYTLGANVERLVVRDIATIGNGNSLDNVIDGRQSNLTLTLDGGAGNDILYGSNQGRNTLIGGEGADTIIAAGLNNTLNGGNGNDIYYSDSATNLIVETNADRVTGGFDTLYAGYDVVMLAANIEQLILQGAANSGIANATDNYLSSRATHGVTLDGGAGNDYLTGSAYDDILVGGTGNDQFDLRTGGHDTLIYTQAGFGRDTVTGFDATSAAGRDVIDVSGRGLTATDVGTQANAAIRLLSFNGGTIVYLGTDQINLVGVNTALMTAADFKF